MATKKEVDNERLYQPEKITTTMEGTAQELLAFMLTNSGITETEYHEMTRRQWSTIRDKLNINDVIQTLKVFGYKLIAIPNANYMLSKVESYQFVLPEDKIRPLDRAKGEIVPFKPITPEELAKYGITLARQKKMQNAIFAASLDSDKVNRSNLKRANEIWAFKVNEPKKYQKMKEKYEEKLELLRKDATEYRKQCRREWYNKHKDELKAMRVLNKKEAELKKKEAELNEPTKLNEPDVVEVAMDDPIIVAMREKRMAKKKKKSEKTDE